MVVKKTFRITEVRNEQLELISEYLQEQGFKGTQTEVLEKAIMNLYSEYRQGNRAWFMDKEDERRKMRYDA